MLVPPGQHEIYRASARSELWLVVKQGFALLLVGWLGLGVLVGLSVVVGPWLWLIAGLGLLGAGMLFGLASADTKEAAVAVLLVGFTLATGWLLFGLEAVSFLIEATGWRTIGAMGFLWAGFVLYVVGWRLVQEIADPKWSPPIASRPAGWGPLLPWTKIPSEVVEVPEPEEVVHPFPVFTTATARQGNGRTLRAPNGRNVNATKVREMIEDGQHIGLAYRAWTVRGWERSDWEAAQSLLASLGVITTPQARKRTKFLMDTDDALAMLGELL